MSKIGKLVIILLVVSFVGNYLLPFGVSVKAFNEEVVIEDKPYEEYTLEELSDYYDYNLQKEAELNKAALELEEKLKDYIIESDYYYTFDIPQDANIDIDVETLNSLIEGLDNVNEGLSNGELFIYNDEIYISEYDEEYVINGGKNGIDIAYVKILFAKIPCGIDIYLDSKASTIVGLTLIVIAAYNITKFIKNFELSLSDAKALAEKIDSSFMPIITTFKLGYDAILMMAGVSTGGVAAAAVAVLKIFIKVVINTFLISAAAKYMQNGENILGLIGNNKGTKTTFNVASLKFSISAQ